RWATEGWASTYVGRSPYVRRSPLVRRRIGPWCPGPAGRVKVVGGRVGGGPVVGGVPPGRAARGSPRAWGDGDYPRARESPIVPPVGVARPRGRRVAEVDTGPATSSGDHHVEDVLAHPGNHHPDVGETVHRIVDEGNRRQAGGGHEDASYHDG